MRRRAGTDPVRRIAFVTDAVYPFHRGGRETRLHEITRRLVREGRDVRIYTMKWWEETAVSVSTVCGSRPSASITRSTRATDGRSSRRCCSGSPLCAS